MLKNRLFILILSISSLILLLSGMVYYKNINAIYEEQSNIGVNHDRKMFENFINLNKKNIKDLTENISNNENLISSLNLISNYQNPNNYSKDTFDYEKEKILENTNQWINLNKGISLSIYDKNQNPLVINKNLKNNRTFGYFSYENSNEIFINKLNNTSIKDFKFEKIDTNLLNMYDSNIKKEVYVFSYLKEIKLNNNIVGYIKTCINIQSKALINIYDNFIHDIILQLENNNYIFTNKINEKKFNILLQSKDYEIKKINLLKEDKPLYLINIINKSSKNEKLAKTLQTMIFLWILILSLTLFLSYLFTNRYIIKPIQQLQLLVHKIKNRNNLSSSKSKNIRNLESTKSNELEVISSEFKSLAKQLDKNIAFLNSYKNVMDESAIVSKADLNGKITYVNDNFVNASGYTKKELIGSPHSIIRHPDTPKSTFEDLWKTIKDKKVWKGTLKNKRKDGSYYWVNIVIRPLLDENNKISKYIALRYDITELIEQREKLNKLANTDSLTDLDNRFKLINDIKKIHTPALSFLNIDNFRQTNDFYGHYFGDLIIKKVSSFLKLFCKNEKNLHLYRTQADEFAIIANISKDYDKDAFYDKIYDIIRKINNTHLEIENEEISLNLTASISYEDKNIILSTANMALKHAKKQNLHMAVYKDEFSLDKIYANNIKWTMKLKSAIKDDKIIPFFQPIVNNNTGKFEKFESLVRLIDENNQVISPYFFLDVAKQTKHYEKLTKIMISKSFETFKNNNLEFSINLTIDDILNNTIKEYIYEKLEEYNIGSRVVFEIVESESIENFENISTFITEIKKYGCKIAIDDFGTGYSNFEYLLKLNADYIKIDGSMIKNIHKDENAKMVVSVIVDFAKKMKMKTIAEFVENEEILKVVKELDIDYSQGYYFSAPKQELD